MSETPDLKRIIQCGLSDAVDAIGERWSFLILRGAFNNLVHFEEFQQTLGIARNILANRLGRWWPRASSIARRARRTGGGWITG